MPYFDVADEFQRGLDNYCAKYLPELSEVCELIKDIAEFIYEFTDTGLEAKCLVPAFHRSKVIMSDLKYLHIDMKVGDLSKPLDEPWTEEEMRYYFYRRWIWMQFPWLGRKLMRIYYCMQIDNVFFTALGNAEKVIKFEKERKKKKRKGKGSGSESGSEEEGEDDGAALATSKSAPIIGFKSRPVEVDKRNSKKWIHKTAETKLPKLGTTPSEDLGEQLHLLFTFLRQSRLLYWNPI
jgi:hypothetical protein